VINFIRKTDGAGLHGQVVNYYQANSLNSANVLLIPISEIVSIELSAVSSMPSGLLNTLTKEDILDMVAWLSSAN
tara:strand:- start:7845 stop:8069 length:225 start_codon:yes stop_codon:yes gene_type:complete